MRITGSVVATGPFFDLPNLSGMVQDELRETINELMEYAWEEVRVQLYPGHGWLTGHYHDSIKLERADKSKFIARVHDSGVVYGPWLEGISSRNDVSRFKGYAMFRNARERVKAKAAAITNAHVRVVVRKLGGS